MKLLSSKVQNPAISTLNLNNERDFEQLYVAYYEKLCIYLLNYTSDKKRIEDVVQDTFVSVWKKRDDIKVTESVKSYLYRSVYHKLIDTVRQTKRTDMMLSEYYHTALLRAADSDTDYKTHRLQQLDECIDMLPLRCKNVFLANKISGKKYQQVADDFEISLKTVEGHITRAFKLIKECVDDRAKNGLVR